MFGFQFAEASPDVSLPGKLPCGLMNSLNTQIRATTNTYFSLNVAISTEPKLFPRSTLKFPFRMIKFSHFQLRIHIQQAGTLSQGSRTRTIIRYCISFTATSHCIELLNLVRLGVDSERHTGRTENWLCHLNYQSPRRLWPLHCICCLWINIRDF